MVVDDDRSLSLLPSLVTRNAAAMPLNEHSTHSIPPFCSLSTSSATRKNVSWCAWRFIKFELQHGIESHRRHRNSSSNELEKPFLEPWRKWMRRAESRKKKGKEKGSAENRAYLESLSRKLLLVLPETSVFGQEQFLTTLTYLNFFHDRILDRTSLLLTTFRRSEI